MHNSAFLSATQCSIPEHCLSMTNLLKSSSSYEMILNNSSQSVCSFIASEIMKIDISMRVHGNCLNLMSEPDSQTLNFHGWALAFELCQDCSSNALSGCTAETPQCIIQDSIHLFFLATTLSKRECCGNLSSQA